MENDVLQKKDSFPKSVANMCQVVEGWKNEYNNKYNRFLDANDGAATSVMSQKKRKGKPKMVTCYKCKKNRHFANECDEEDTIQTSNKEGSNFIVFKKNQEQCINGDEKDEKNTMFTYVAVLMMKTTLHSCNMTLCALSKMKLPYQKDGYYWTASPP